MRCIHVMVPQQCDIISRFDVCSLMTISPPAPTSVRGRIGRKLVFVTTLVYSAIAVVLVYGCVSALRPRLNLMFAAS